MSNSKLLKPGMIYLILEREFLKTDENIFKLGRTQTFFDRMMHYPKGSQLFGCIKCNDTVGVEKNLISQFCKLFKARRDIGREYFEGDPHSMMLTIITVINEWNPEAEQEDEQITEKKIMTEIPHVIKEFLSENESKYSNTIQKSKDVYQHLVDWISDKQYDMFISHNKMSRELRNIFGVFSKGHHFSSSDDIESVCEKALFFPDLSKPPINVLKPLLEQQYVITHNHDDFVESRELIDFLVTTCRVIMSETKIGIQLSNEMNLIKDMKKINKKAIRIYRGIKRIN